MPPFTPRVEGHMNSPSTAHTLLPSPICSPVRVNSTELHLASRGARRKLQFVTQAVPAGHFSPPLLSARDVNNRSRLDTVPVVDAAACGATMGSSFRRLLTSSQPDIQTLHTILVSLHRSEATPTDLHHASQAIGLLASLASDRHGCADCADMATAILSTLATYPKTRTQLPAHARRQLADALIEIVGYNKSCSAPQPAIALQPGPHVAPATTALPKTISPGTRARKLSLFSKHSISLASQCANGAFLGPNMQNRARSQSPDHLSTSNDASSPSGRSASLPPAIGESQLNTQSLLSSPGSPRRQLKSFAQRAIERLQEARPASPPGSNTSVPPCVPANQLDVPESLRASQHDKVRGARGSHIDELDQGGSGTKGDSHVPNLLDYESTSRDKLQQEQEKLQESMSGVSGVFGTASDRSMPVAAAHFLQAAIQKQNLTQLQDGIPTESASGEVPVHGMPGDGVAATNATSEISARRGDGPKTAGAAAFLDSQRRSLGRSATSAHAAEVTFKGISPPMSSATNSLRETSMWPSSLQDTDSEPAMARALSLVLSKCGLARSGGLTEPLTPAAAAEAAASALGSTDTLDDGVSIPGRASEASGRRSAEEEAPMRRAGRWVLATLAAAAAATADDVIMDELNSKHFTAMLSGWLDQGDNIQSTTAVLVSLALLEARPKPMRDSSRIPGSDSPPPAPFHSPTFIDTLASRCSSMITRHSSPFARILAMRASAASGVVSTRTMRVSDSVDVDIGLHMHDYIVMGLSHLGVSSSSAPCAHSLLAPLIPSFHGRGQSPTVASAAATAVAAISATSGEDLERFVDAGAISGLTRGLTSGLREEAADCAAALAVLARLPSAHPHLLRSGACDVLLRCAGSRNTELQDAQAGIAAALAHLSCNGSMQFTLVGKGLAGSVCALIAHAPSACMPAVAKVIIAVAREGNMQGSVLVRAGVVKELVAFLRRRLPCAHLRSAHASLHALLIHARSVAAAEALQAGAMPHLLFSLSSSDQKTRKRAARMLSLLLEASAMEASAILARLDCAVPLLRLLRHGDFAERAEAVDLIYLLRGSTQVMRALGSDGGTSLQALADVLTSCTPYHPHSHLRPRPPADISPWQIPAARPPTAAIPSPSPPAPNAAAAAAAAAESAAAARAQQRRSAAVRHSGAMNNGLDESAGRLLFSSSGSGAAATSSSGWRWQWDADGSDEGLTAAEVGLFSSSASAGARINTDAIVGKVVRVLCSMAIHPEARDAVARCSHLADPLSRLLVHHRGLHRWSSMCQASLPLPQPEKPPSFLGSQNKQLSNSDPTSQDLRYDADGEGGTGDSDDVRGSASSGEEGGDVQPPIVDVSDDVLERIRNILEVRAESPPSFRLGLRLHTAGDPKMLSVPASTTYEAAELLLSWLLDMKQMPPAHVLEPLCLQAWLGNNVDVIHTSRFNTNL